MNATQKHLLKLLLEIDEICKKNDIQYFIDYGTTLGAVRHEGFIPWDDDIDIMLTEDNYYKWVEACKKELDPSKRVYNDVRLDREFPTVFGRYNDLESARVGERSEFWKPICGQCIDVFCLLELPGDPVKKQKAIDLYFAYDEYSNSSYRHVRMKTERWMELYKKFLFWEKIVGKERVLRALEKKIFHQHYDDCDTYIVTSARKKGPTSIVPKKCYDSVYMANFEGHKFPIAGKYIELLNVYYEDTYCMLPEHKKQHSKMSHTGIGCDAYVSDYMRFIDKEKMLKERQEFKHIAVEEGYRTTFWCKEFFEKVGACELLKIQTKIRKNNLNILDYLDPSDKNKLAVLDDLFSEYYEKQMDSSVRAWEVYFNIGDELQYAAIFNLLYNRNDYYSIAKILNLREINGLSRTKELDDLWNTVLLLRKVKAETIYGNYENANAYCDEGLKKYPYCREMRICRLILDACTASGEKEYAECEEKAMKLLAEYPDDDQCIKVLGDLAYMRNDIDSAQRYYDWVMEHSINGMLHLDIRKKMGERYD